MRRETVMKVSAIPLAAIMAWTVLTTLALAAEKPTAAKTDRPASAEASLPFWDVTCSNANTASKLQCFMQQSLATASTKQRVLSMRLQHAGEKQALTATIQLPHGVRLQQGVKFSIDGGKPYAMPVIYADAAGSYVVFTVDPELEKVLKTGHQIKFEIVSLAGQSLVFTMPLDGFAKALGMI